MFKASIKIVYKDLKVVGSLLDELSEYLKVADDAFVKATASFAHSGDIIEQIQKLEAKSAVKVDVILFVEQYLLTLAVRDFLINKGKEGDFNGMSFTLIAALAYKNPELFKSQLQSGFFEIDLESLLELYGIDSTELEKSINFERGDTA